MSIIAKYKFDSSIYADLIPEFNAGFTNYNIADEIEGNIITRTIESDSLPTLMRLGRSYVNGETDTDNRTDSLLEVLDMNTSGLTNCHNMFRYCKNLTSITCEWDTSNVTSMEAMFNGCNELTTLDVSNFNTSNVINMKHMFYDCNKLTSLDVSNFNTSNVTNMSYMFHSCKSLTTLDVSNFDTSKVTDICQMFYNCKSLTTLDLSNWNTSNVTNMQQVFDLCYVLNVDVSNWNTSNVTNIYAMFGDCRAMSSLDLSKWNTSKMTNMLGVFWGCTNLVELNISSWDTSKVTNMKKMFYDCTKLTTLDISNFNTSKVTDASEMFANAPLLTDIGMIYCDQSTIDKVASLLPTDITQTIWVEDVDVKDLTPVEGVEFKQYAKNTEVMLTSPLLEGDKLIVKDGKTYHYHKMGKVVLDGSIDEDWSYLALYDDIYDYRFKVTQPKINNHQSLDLCDMVNVIEPLKVTASNKTEGIAIYPHNADYSQGIFLTKKYSALEELINWLQANPTTVVYELASPYYELISDEPLTTSLIAESSDIKNSSNIPLNMTINNKGLSTVAMSPSTTYTVAFNKDTDGEVVVNLCGNEVATTDNIVEITTPSEIDDELIFYGDGVEVSNVRLLEGSMSGDSVPKESFEGLKNSFEDGYIPENKIANIQPNLNNVSTSTQYRWDYKTANGGITICTVYTTEDNISLPYRRKGIVEWVENVGVSKGISVYIAPEGMEFYGIQKDYGTTLANPEPFQAMVLEGDWTHLTEEDFNNLGKYKVEYKVTGKNKLNTKDFHFNTANGVNCSYDANTGTFTHNGTGYGDVQIYAYLHKKTYIVNVQTGTRTTFNIMKGRQTKYVNSASIYSETIQNYIPIVIDEEGWYTFHMALSRTDNVIWTFSNIQIEEGTTPTEYEPYKEYTKTFYLNSPLLEGDTIEDVNGVATHVKRYEKVVFDGSEDEGWSQHAISSVAFLCSLSKAYLDTKQFGKVYCDKLRPLYDNFGDSELVTKIQAYMLNGAHMQVKISASVTTLNDFKAWLQANPTTVVYQLASPIYEPISTESILCDSYTNGHLDVDTNIPIEKVKFGRLNFPTVKYLQPNTKYRIQFESDNAGILNNIYHGNDGNSSVKREIVKGKNIIDITTLDNVAYPYFSFNGIGFNASNIQVVATDKDVNFGYFKGLQSSFESELVTDEADENYGKYKVEVKVTGKNKFDGLLESGDINVNTGALKAEASCVRTINYIDVRNMDEITLTRFDHTYTTSFRLYDSSYNYIGNASGLGSANTVTLDVSNVSYIKFRVITSDTTIKFQLEEGTQATPYEPYQEYTKTIHLNSPLLKGDTIEVHNGKLCHYHKMVKVVLDGSDDENWRYDSTYSVIENRATVRLRVVAPINSPYGQTTYSNRFTFLSDDEQYVYQENNEGICVTCDKISINILKSKLSTQDVNGFKQWLQANPTTVVYELAEPYYEEISPLQEDLIITSVKEGDLHIDTIVPISSKVTYNVNVQLLTDFEQSIVEQVQATQTTDLQSILDEEIDN